MTNQRRLPNDDLSRWIRAHPDLWHVAEDEQTPADVAHLVERIVGASRQRHAQSKVRRRRIVLACLAGTGSLGAAAGVAAWMRAAQPTQPNLIMCRAEPARQASGVVIDATTDPVAGCRAMWSSGEVQEPTLVGDVANLTACVADSGAVDVFPGPPTVCDDLGVELLEEPLTVDNQAILSLNQRIIDEINARPCAAADAVKTAAEQILIETGLDEWTVVIGTGWDDAQCAKVAVDAPTRTLTISGV